MSIKLFLIFSQVIVKSFWNELQFSKTVTAVLLVIELELESTFWNLHKHSLFSLHILCLCLAIHTI